MRSVVLCPFTAGTALWQSQSGAWTLSVCVRGTFSLVHGREAILADAQEPVGVDRYLDDDPQRSLYAPSDIVPFKPRADVVLVGSAFAPGLEPVEALVARLTLGSLDKSLGVIGDRAWIEGPDGPEPSAPRPFRSMPLTYERAARARDNPHGFDLTRAPLVGALALPNLEAADDEIGGDRTVGFGPVSPVAASRRTLLRADGWAWAVGGGVGPAPAGFDFSFYNAAPRDQQVDEILGGDTLVLTNLNRDTPRLESRLPTVRAKAFLVAGDLDSGVEIPLRCDTLWIDTDRALVALSWRGVMTVETADEDVLGTLVVAAESKGRTLRYEKIAKILRNGLNATTDSDTFTESRRSEPDAEAIPRSAPFMSKVSMPSVSSITSVRIQAEDTSPPLSWEELTGSDIIDIGSPDDPKTLPGGQGRVRSEDTADEVKTKTAVKPLVLDETFDEVKTKTAVQPLPKLYDEPTTSPTKPLVQAPPKLYDEPSTTATKRLIKSPEARIEDTLDEVKTKPAIKVPVPVRGALGAADYARIAVAAERGEPARALFRYGLALPDLPRLRREWTEKSAADVAFAKAFIEALEVERRAGA